MGSPRIFNHWGEEEARLPLNERSLLIVASRFRRDARIILLVFASKGRDGLILIPSLFLCDYYHAQMSIPKESFHIRLHSIFLGRFAPKRGKEKRFAFKITIGRMLTFLHSSSLCLYSLPFLVLACGVGGLPLRRYSLHVRAVWVLVYVSISYSPVRKREQSDSCEPLQFSFLHSPEHPPNGMGGAASA